MSSCIRWFVDGVRAWKRRRAYVGEMCAVCRDEMHLGEEIAWCGSCGHCFHAACLRKWGERGCPYRCKVNAMWLVALTWRAMFLHWFRPDGRRWRWDRVASPLLNLAILVRLCQRREFGLVMSFLVQLGGVAITSWNTDDVRDMNVIIGVAGAIGVTGVIVGVSLRDGYFDPWPAVCMAMHATMLFGAPCFLRSSLG